MPKSTNVHQEEGSYVGFLKIHGTTTDEVAAKINVAKQAIQQFYKEIDDPFWEDICQNCGYSRGHHYTDIGNPNNPEKVTGSAWNDNCYMFKKKAD